MVGNDFVGIRQVSLLVVFHSLICCRPSSHQGGNENYGVSGSSQQGGKMENYGSFLRKINYIRQGATECSLELP